MTPKEILDSFSATLMQDDRILSTQERALLTTLLQHARLTAGRNRETQEAVRAVIAGAVGETVAHRAFSVLGANIVEQILENNPLSTDSNDAQRAETRTTESQLSTRVTLGPKPPQPPNQPQPPGVRMPIPVQPQPPGAPVPPAQPQPPGSLPMDEPRQPQPPGKGVRTNVVSQTSVGIAARPAVLAAKCVVLDEFLAPQELDQLMRFTLEHEADFRASEVVSLTAEGGVINDEHRRSRVLLDLAQHQDLMLERIRTVLPQVLQKLGMEQIPIAGVEAQITASNDGDFFHFHSDNGSEKVASRYLTFVYFFQREPRQFHGGELRIHDSQLAGDEYVSEGTYQMIAPQQNQIVFFPCELMHEVTEVKCPSRLFADSRFTLNGWLLG
jgi:Rps23 Pro-64 3,4-dihydroxylase Tpa1-like proline 4-hydroxylase